MEVMGPWPQGMDPPLIVPPLLRCPDRGPVPILLDFGRLNAMCPQQRNETATPVRPHGKERTSHAWTRRRGRARRLLLPVPGEESPRQEATESRLRGSTNPMSRAWA